jgi:predicted transcriptional regulator
LKQLLFDRVAVSEIARELGRTEGAIRTRAQQEGISLRAIKNGEAQDR